MRKAILGHVLDVSSGKVLKNQKVKISEKGRIAAVETGDRSDDVYLLPGLIDAHVHLVLEPYPNKPAFVGRESRQVRKRRIERNVKEALKHGVTTVRDCGFPGNDDLLQLRDKINNNPKVGCRIVAAGPLITTPKGHGRELGVEARGEKQMQRVCQDLIDRGVNFIKLVNNDPKGFSVKEMKAAKKAAHAVGLMLACHVYQPEVLERIVEAGVDTIEHFIDTKQEVLEQIKAQGVIVVPTYIAAVDAVEHPEANELGEESIGEEMTMSILEWAERLKKGTIQAIETGLKIAAGTDAGFLWTDFGSVIREIRGLAELGMSNLDALRAATLVAAEAVGRKDDLGLIEVGKWADVVAYKRNPLEDLSVLSKPLAVYREGRLVYQAF